MGLWKHKPLLRNLPVISMRALSALLLLPLAGALSVRGDVGPVLKELPSPALTKINIGTADFQTQGLPLSAVSSWPVWMAAADATTVTRLPDEQVDGWCNPNCFEQLWLPLDLPVPSCRPALGVVLKDAQVRYVFPTLEATVTSSGGYVWHNRGLNSLPLAKTWLPFGDVPIEDLVMSAYTQTLPADSCSEEEGSETEGSKTEGSEEAASNEEWKPVLAPTPIQEAFNMLLRVLADAPDELGVRPQPNPIITCTCTCHHLS